MFCEDFTITFSWFKMPTSTFTFKTWSFSRLKVLVGAFNPVGAFSVTTNLRVDLRLKLYLPSRAREAAAGRRVILITIQR